ncbi:MAG: DUF433 domain-containing protein [Euryarchaeota archaeon]|nr:DUF433 domain-containing protein [Euryarchaeota archaeon]
MWGEWGESIIEKLAAGESLKQLIEEHPRLSDREIHAAVAFASAALRADAVYPVARRNRWNSRVTECVDRIMLDYAYRAICC